MTNEEIEKAIAELWALFKETDRKVALIAESVNQLTDKFREEREQMKETDRKVARAAESVDKLTDKWGRFIEYFLAPGIPQLFSALGYEINDVMQRRKKKLHGEKMEIDLLGVNDEYVVAVSVKSTLGVDDVREHLEDLSRFKEFFTVYSAKKVLGAVAGIEIAGEADKFAYHHGLFVLCQSGDTVVILNDEKFKPKVW